MLLSMCADAGDAAIVPTRFFDGVVADMSKFHEQLVLFVRNVSWLFLDGNGGGAAGVLTTGYTASMLQYLKQERAVPLKSCWKATACV